MDVNERFLEDQGFVRYRNLNWHFKRAIRIAFSDPAILYADRSWIKSAVEKRVDPGLFVFYFHEQPESGEICMRMLAEMELMNLLPQIRLVKLQGTPS